MAATAPPASRAAAATAPPAASATRRFPVVIATTLAALMQTVDTSIVNVAIPNMMGELGASIDEVAWVSTGYILAAVIVMPITGWLSGYFGRKRYFAASILIFTVASFFCGASGSLGALIFWRIVQGIGGGALITTSQAILYETFPPEEVGPAIALFGVGVMVGPTIGPTLGGWLTDRYSWPWIFYVNVPIGIAAAAMVMGYVRDSANEVKARTIDYLGLALLALSVGSLQYLLEHGQRVYWLQSWLIVTLAWITVVGGALLVWRELAVGEPVVDFRVMRHREVIAGTVIGILMGVGLFGSVFVMPLFLQGALRMTAFQTGMVLLPGSIATVVSMGITGRVVNRVDARALIAVGISLFAFSMWRLSHVTAEAGAHDFFWPLICRGLGLGMMFVPLTNITMASLAPREIAAGAALSNFFRQLGGSLGIAALSTLLTRYTEQGRAVLVEHVTAYDPVSLERLATLTSGFAGRGNDPVTARQLALAVLDGEVMAQASVIAFGKVYLLSGVILLATLPLLLLVRRAKPAAAGVRIHVG